MKTIMIICIIFENHHNMPNLPVTTLSSISFALMLLFAHYNTITMASAMRARPSIRRKDYKDLMAFIRGSCGVFRPRSREQAMLPVAFRCPDDVDSPSSSHKRHCNPRRSLQRLAGGWSALQAFKSHAIINFAGTTSSDELKKWRCSGAMIDNDMVLTAQSCLEREKIRHVSSMTLNYGEVIYGLGYCTLDGFKQNKDKTYDNDVAIIRFNVTKGVPKGQQADCIDFGMRPKRGAVCAVVSEGQRTRDDDDVSVNTLRTRALFIENQCPTEAAKRLTHSDQSCWTRHKGPREFEGNLCQFDKGSPVLCVDHCQPGWPRLVLVGLVSSVLPKGLAPIAPITCDKTQFHPDDAIIVTNLHDIQDKLIKKLNICLDDPV